MTANMVTIGAWDFYPDSPLGMTYGFNSPHAIDAKIFSDMGAAGMSRVRLNVVVDNLVASSPSASPSTWNWGFVDAAVEAANKANLRVTLIARGLHNMPSNWSVASACDPSGIKFYTTAANYAKIAVALARRYSGDGNVDNKMDTTGKKALQADAIEVGNEEFNTYQDSLKNISVSPLVYPTGCDSPMRYVSYVRTVLPLLRASTASGGGGWVPRGNFLARVGMWGIVHSNQLETKVDFTVMTAPPTDATWNAGGNHNSIFGFDSTLNCQMLDYANYHNYTNVWSAGGTDYDQGKQCADIRNILNAAGNTTIPIWCTETGTNGPINGQTESYQAKFYTANADGTGSGVLAALRDNGCQHLDLFTMNDSFPNKTSTVYVGEAMTIVAVTRSGNTYKQFQAYQNISNFANNIDKGAWAAKAWPAGFAGQPTGGGGGGGGGGGTPGGGVLTGAFAPLAATNVNLTTEAATGDYAHWGVTGTTFDHKATGGSQISDATVLGNASKVQNPGALNTFTYTDGTPNTTETATATGIKVQPAVAGTTGSPGLAGQAPTPHVIVIALENTGYSGVVGNSNYANINSYLSTYSTCTKAYGFSHPSLPNYLTFASGWDQGVTIDGYNPNSAPLAGNTLVDQLNAAGINWRHYQENMPSPGYLGSWASGGNGDSGSGATLWTAHHNPWIYFKTIRNASSAYQHAHMVDYTQLATDLAGGTAPPFIFVTPSNSHNAHTGTDAAADAFVGTLVSMVQASTWYTANNGIIVLWWDESGPGDTDNSGIGDTGSNSAHQHGGHICCVVISANNSHAKLASNINHAGVLRGIQKLYGLNPFLGKAANTINGDLTPLLGVGSGGPPPAYTLLPGQVVKNGISNYVFGTNYSAISGMSVPTPTSAMNDSVAAAGLTLMRVFLDNTATDPQITGRVNAVIATGCTPLVCLYSATNSTFNQHVVTLLGSTCLIYEFGNEPDGTVQPIASATFNSAWNTQIPLLRAINPSAAFLSPGFNNGNSSYLTSWLNTCHTSGVLPDGVGFHLYACGGVGTSSVCLTHTSDYATQINTLRSQVTSVLGVARPIGISEWNVDYHFPEASYAHDEPFVNNYYLGVLTSMISANLDYACQFACFGTTAFHMLNENTGAATAYYTAMAEAIATLSPTSPPTTNNTGNGLEITAPADTNSRTLKIYTDVNQGIATLVARLSDASAPDFLDSTLQDNTGGNASAGVYTITYQAASSGQTLSVFYTLSDNKVPGVANASDTFNRSDQSGLGPSSDGESYTTVKEVGNPAWAIASDQAKMTGSVGDTGVAVLGTHTLLDCESVGIVNLSNGADSGGLILRSNVGGTTYYRASLQGSAILLAYVTGGVSTILNSQPASPKTNTNYWLRFRIVKSSLYAKFWPNDGTAEPTNWNVFASDTTLAGAGNFGFRAVIGAASDFILFDTYSIVDLSAVGDPSYVSLYAADLPTGVVTASGSISVVTSTPSGTIDLTAVGEGDGDWIKPGYSSASSLDRKANVTQQISAVSPIGSGTYTQNIAALLAWSWEDGTPDTAVVASTTESTVQGAANGFSFSVPADTTPRTLNVYVAAKQAQGTLTATLSDGSFASYSDTSLNDVSTGTAKKYQITYNAASPSQALTITWTMLTDNGGGGSTTTFSTDTYVRSNQSGWGLQSDAVNTWGVAAGVALPSIVSNKGQITSATAGAVAVMFSGTGVQANGEISGRYAATATIDSFAVILRATSSTTYYKAQLSSAGYTITKVISGVSTDLATASTIPTLVAGTKYFLKLRLNGSNLYSRTWADGSTEPTAWALTATDSSISGSGQYGIRGRINTGGDIVTVDSFLVTSIPSGGSPGNIAIDAASMPLVVVAGGGGGGGGGGNPPPAVNTTITVNATDKVVPNTWTGLGVQQDPYTQGTWIINGSFEDYGGSPWYSPWSFLVTSPAVATISKDISVFEDGASSAKINITTAAPGSNFDVQLRQIPVSLLTGSTYTITFWAKADSARNIDIVLQQSVTPFTVYSTITQAITTSWVQYTITYVSTVTDSTPQLAFNLAAATGNIWIDAVTVNALSINSVQRALINTRLGEINPSVIRTCADAVSWWCPSVAGTYTFDNPLMLEWYNVFEYAQANGINVIVGVNSPAPFATLSTSWCTAFADLINYLINTLGYTCIQYVSGLSEPDSM